MADIPIVETEQEEEIAPATVAPVGQDPVPEPIVEEPIPEETIAPAEISRRLDALANMKTLPDPIAAQRARQASEVTGVPEDVASRNIDEVERMAKMKTRPSGADIQNQAPVTAEFMSDPDNYALMIDGLREHVKLESAVRSPTTSFWRNNARAFADRTTTLAGNLIQFVGEASESLDETFDRLGIPNPGIIIEEDGYSWTWDMPDDVPDLLKEVGQQVGMSQEFAEDGYMPRFTWENFKGDMNATNLAGYVVEQGIQSVPDMIATMVTLVPYMASRSEEIAEERVKNNGGTDVEGSDLLASMPTAVAVALSERYATRGVLGALADKSKVRTLGDVFTEIGRSAGREAITEFFQESLEYLGETVGTEKDVSIAEMADRGIAGAVAGGPMGGAFRGPTAAFQAVQQRRARGITGEIISRFDQTELDSIIESAQSSTLYQGDKKKFADYIKKLAGDDRLYMDPEALAALEEAGVTLPDSITSRARGNEDISLTYDEFAGLLENDAAMAAVRPYLKRAPLMLTQKELNDIREGRVDSDGSTEALIQRAVQEREVRSEADRIYDQIKTQIEETGRQSAETAKYSAQLIPAYVTTKVTELREQGVDVSVADIYRAMNFRVEGPATTPEVQVDTTRILNQAYDQGYEGDNLLEADEWSQAFEKFGAEGMTLEARMARAREMGFDVDTVMYHGTRQVGKDRQGITSFRPNKFGLTFFSPNPVLANDFSGQGNMEASFVIRGLEQHGFGPNVMPVYLNVDNTFDFRDHSQIDALIDSLDRVDPEEHMLEMGLEEPSENEHIEILSNEYGRHFVTPKFLRKRMVDGDYEYLEAAEVVAVMSDMGFDSLYVKELRESEIGKMGIRADTDPYATLNVAVIGAPRRIRSVNAAFDPDYESDPNILRQAGLDLAFEQEQMTIQSLIDAELGDVNTVAKLARAIDDLAAGTIGRLEDTSDENKDVISDILAHDALVALENTDRGEGGGQWYREKIENAMAVAALMHPELATDPNKMVVFKAIMAITSNGSTVTDNVKHTDEIYDYYKRHGSIPVRGWGKETKTTKKKMKLLGELIKVHGEDGLANFLNQRLSVRDLRDIGYKVNGELIDESVPASMIFGPKLGVFFQNLSGDYDFPTMDRWFMRTWGRVTGTNMNLREKAFPKRAKTLRDAIKAHKGRIPGYQKPALMKDDELLLEFARDKFYEFQAGGFSDKSPINNASRNLHKGVNEPVMAPRNGSQRKFIRETLNLALEKIKDSGLEIDVASVQAILWYEEKALFTEKGIGDRRIEATDYEIEFRRLYETRFGSPAPTVGDQRGPGDGRQGQRGDAVEPRQDTEFGDSPLEGAPAAVDVPGRGPVVFAPHGPAVSAKKKYAEQSGLPFVDIKQYATIDIERAERLAQAYAEMKHDPSDPEVQAAYAALIEETIAQFRTILDTGLKIEFIKGADPYAESPRLAILDVTENNHLWVYPTRDGFGSDEAFDVAGNPLLAETEFEIDGVKLLANDVFRVVHDYFGHIAHGVGFRAEGEENAWQAHASMFSPLARRAMTTETRGQNSWVNFGPFGEQNRTAPSNETVFADQKTGLLPLWASEEGKIWETKVPKILNQAPANAANRVLLTHYSRKTGLNNLDPNKFGTGLRGAERRRAGGRNWVPRTYYGLNVGEPGGYVKEAGLGAETYTTSIDPTTLYDIANDPLNLRDTDMNQFETNIKNAGYAGYVVNHPSLGRVAAVYDAMPVETMNGIPVLNQSAVADADIVASRRRNLKRLGFNVELRLFHGTAQDFENFAKGGVRPQYVNPQMELGFFFTAEPDVADLYSSPDFDEYIGPGPGSNIRPVYLKLQNPYRAERRIIDEIESTWSTDETLEWKQGLIDQGYDGVVFDADPGLNIPEEYVVFNPGQIASALTLEAQPQTLNQNTVVKLGSAAMNKTIQLESAKGIPDVAAAESFLDQIWEASEPHPFDSKKRIMDGFVVHMYRRGERVYLSEVMNLIPENRGQGLGTAFVDGLLAMADGAGVPIELIPEAFASEEDTRDADSARLREWYKRLGFEEDSIDPDFLVYYPEVMESLPMDMKSRLKRARELGFNTAVRWYHGTSTEFDGFTPRSFFTTNPKLASGFSNPNYMWKDQARGERVLPVFLATNKTFDAVNGAHRAELRKYLEATMGEPNQFGHVQFHATKSNMVYNVSIDQFMKDIESGNWSSIEFKEVESFIAEAGYDSFYVMEGNNRNISVLDPSKVRSINAKFDPRLEESTNLLAQEARGQLEFTEDSRVVRLLQTADLSTFLHEVGHLFLETEKQFSKQYGTTANQEAILEMLNVESFDDIGVPEHELWATTWEDYLRTGKAPSLKLRDAFAAFSRWLTQIYKNIKQLGMPLDENITEIFDRLLATQTEIEEASMSPENEQFFRSKEQAGMTDAEWKKYQELLEKRKNRQQMTLEEKLLKEITARYTNDWNEEKQPIVDKWIADLSEEPIYMLIEALKDVPMDNEAVKLALGVDRVPPGRLMSKVKKGGMDPVVYAESYGFDSVPEMLKALNETPTVKDKANEIAQQIMIERHGDILNDGTIEQEAREAFHNDAQAEVLLEEIRLLKKQDRSGPSINRKAIQAEAKNIVALMKPADMKPDKYYRAEIRAAQRAATATNPKEAREAKIQQLVNHYLFREATAARRDMVKHKAHISRVRRQKYDTAKVNSGYITNMKLLANLYNTTNVEKQKVQMERILDWYEGQLSNAESGYADLQLLDLNLVNALEARRDGTWEDFQPTMLKEMTVEEVRSVYDMLRHMRFIGGILSNEARAQDKKRTDALLKSILENGGKDTADPDAPGKWDQFRENMSHYLNLIPSVRNLMRVLDKFEDGVAYDEIYTRLTTGADTKLSLSRSIHDKYEAELQNLVDLTLDRNKSSEITIQKENGGKFTLASEGRIMLALYWGTESSREAIRVGHKVTDADVERMLSTLTDDQLKLVESIWKVNESMWPELSAAGVRRYGVAPAKLAPSPFTVNGREMTGGHMRLFYQNLGPDTDYLDGETFYNSSAAPTKAGSLYDRIGSGGKKVLLDKHNVFRAIEDNIHFIAFSDIGVDIQRLLGNKKVQAAIVQKHGRGFLRALKESVQGITTNKTSKEVIPVISDWMRILRKAKVFAYLAYSVRNTVQQISALPIVMRDVGEANYIAHFAKFYADYKGNKEFVVSKSEFMRNRAALVNREAAEFLNTITVEGKHVQVWESFKRHGFTPQTVVDVAVAFPAWMAKFEQGMAEHNDEVRAARDADVLVSESVGSGADIHLGSLFRSNQSQFVRTLTMFGSWFNAYYQRMFRATKGGTEFMSFDAVEALLVTPMIVGSFASLLVMDAPAEEEDWIPWMMKRYAAFVGGTMPVVRDMVGYFSGFTPESPLTEVATFPGDVYNTMAKVAEGEDSLVGLASDTIKVGTSVVPVPGVGNITRVLDYVDSYETGAEDRIRDTGDLVREGYQAVVEGPNRNK